MSSPVLGILTIASSWTCSVSDATWFAPAGTKHVALTHVTFEAVKHAAQSQSLAVPTVQVRDPG
eukprot:539692-Pelagomonas_calceolata.AAC.2